MSPNLTLIFLFNRVKRHYAWELESAIGYSYSLNSQRLGSPSNLEGRLVLPSDARDEHLIPLTLRRFCNCLRDLGWLAFS